MLGVCSEYISELFRHIPYAEVTDSTGYVYKTNYSDAVWYFIYALFIFVLITDAFANRIKTKNNAGASLISGVLFWYLIELYEKYCFLAKINNNRLFFNDGSVWQICTMLFIMYFTWRGLTKYNC
jgi:hypothetical protein